MTIKAAYDSRDGEKARVTMFYPEGHRHGRRVKAHLHASELEAAEIAPGDSFLILLDGVRMTFAKE